MTVAAALSTPNGAADDGLSVRAFEGTPAEWDAFVRVQHGARHFHLFGWRRVIEQVYGHDCVSLEARDANGALAGVLGLVRVRSPMFGDFLLSMPYVDYGGPLGNVPAVRALAEAARSMMGRRTLLELRSAVPLPIEADVSHRKIAVVKTLSSDLDLLWTGLRSQVRGAVRKARKANITVQFGGDEIEPFFRVFAHRMRDLGTPTHSQRYFQAIGAEFADSAWFGCAYHQGRAVAGAAAFVLHDELHLLHASQIDAYRPLHPNMLLTWAFIERAAMAGIRRFNFGRSTPGSTTHEFKRRWGAVDEPLYWYDVRNGEIAKTPSPDDAVYAMGPRLWRRLPRRVATALGPHIVKYIP
jgi:FemAB-related protein (PEP-CTERM system-associated)